MTFTHSLTPGERTLGTHYIDGMGSRAGLDAVAKTESSAWELNNTRPALISEDISKRMRSYNNTIEKYVIC